jgi:hypothetical protein
MFLSFHPSFRLNFLPSSLLEQSEAGKESDLPKDLLSMEASSVSPTAVVPRAQTTTVPRPCHHSNSESEARVATATATTPTLPLTSGDFRITVSGSSPVVISGAALGESLRHSFPLPDLHSPVRFHSLPLRSLNPYVQLVINKNTKA